MLLPNTRKAFTGYGLPSRIACSSVGICAAGRSAPSPPSILKRSAPSRLAFASGVRFSIRLGKAADAVHAEHPAARHVDVAGERRQHRDRAHGLDAVRACARWRSPIRACAGLVCANRRAAARIFSAATQVIGSAHSGVNGAHMLAQRVEAVRPALDERRVVELLADDDVEHRQRERVVRCRAAPAARRRRGARARSRADRRR